MVPKLANNKLIVKLLKASGIVCLSVVLTYFLLQPLTFSVSTMLASEDKEDFNVTDIYNAMANSRLVRKLNRNIVVVDIARSDRDDIARILETVALASPAAVGLDVMFGSPRTDSPEDMEGDRRLIDAIAACPNIVLPVKVAGNQEEGFNVDLVSFFYDELPDATYGVTTFPTKHRQGIVRQFAVEYPLVNRDTIPSFSLAVTQLYAPEEAHKCLMRGNTYETINYPSEEFMIIDPEDLDLMAEALTDKIVLIGSINEEGDVHATPVNTRMSGILIHAHAIATILNEAYFMELTRAQNMCLALVLCFLFAFLCVSLNPGIKGIVNRLVQVSLLYVIIVVGYDLFITRAIIVDISYTVMMITFCLFAADIWIGTTFISKKIHARYCAYRRSKALTTVAASSN